MVGCSQHCASTQLLHSSSFCCARQQWSGLCRALCTCRLSMEKATDSTSLECPKNRLVVWPLCRSHSRSVPSQEPDRANWPSWEMTTSWTKCEWPFSDLRANP